MQKRTQKAVNVVIVITAVILLFVLNEVVRVRLDVLYPRVDHWYATTILEQYITLLLNDHVALGVAILGFLVIAGLVFRYVRTLDENIGL